MDVFVNLIYAAVLAGAPLLFGTLGEVLTEKSGNLNLGVEGMMYLGAVAGFAAGFYSNSPVLALVAAFGAGAAGALIYTFLTATLKANQNVTGLTLTIFGTGMANFLGEHILTQNGGTAVLSGELQAWFAPVKIPLLSDIPYVGKLLFQYNIMVYLAVAVAILMGVYLHHTRRGLNLRAVGENPASADASGISVSRYKYANILAGGGICGLGGAYISLVTCGGVWTYNCVAGQGWIAVALVIFAGWSPYRALLGSLAFGVLSVLRFYLPTAAANLIPSAVYSMIPFVATSLVLVIGSLRKGRGARQPAGCGVNYFREER